MVKKYQLNEVKEFDPIEYYSKRIEEVQKDDELNLMQKATITKYFETRKKLIIKFKTGQNATWKERI